MKFFLSPSFLKTAKALYLWLIALCIGAIFGKLNILLLVLAFVIAFYEILDAKLSKYGRIHKIILGASGAVSVFSAFLFALYFSPKIIALQKLGESATQSDEFLSLHAQSEWIFHILFFALTLNFIYRILRD